MKKILVLTMAFLVFGTMSYAQSLKSPNTMAKKEQLKPNAQIKDAKTGAVLKTVKPAKVVTTTNTPIQTRTSVRKTGVRSNKVQTLQQPERFSRENMSLRQSGNSTAKPTSTVVQGAGSPSRSNQVQDVQQPQKFSKEDALKRSNSATKKTTNQSGNSTNKMQKVNPVNIKKIKTINQ